MSGKETLQHKSTRWRCETLGKWTTVVNSKTWAGCATSMWARCPRQAWSHGSLTTEHYRVLVGNHHRGYRSPCISPDPKKELLLLEQINQWLVVLGNTYRMEATNLSNHRVLRTCVTDLGWFQRTQKQTFSNSRRQLTSNTRELEEVTALIQTYTSGTELEGIVYKVSDTSLMSNRIMEKIRMLSMGSTTIHPGFHEDGVP